MYAKERFQQAHAAMMAAEKAYADSGYSDVALLAAANDAYDKFVQASSSDAAASYAW